LPRRSMQLALSITCARPTALNKSIVGSGDERW
jgi:hypothetical protein